MITRKPRLRLIANKSVPKPKADAKPDAELTDVRTDLLQIRRDLADIMVEKHKQIQLLESMRADVDQLLGALPLPN